MEIESGREPMASPPRLFDAGNGSSEDEMPVPATSQYSLVEFTQPNPMVGVSIGKEQTRLASPTTPAAEKAAAMREGEEYFSFPSSSKEAERTGHQKWLSTTGLESITRDSHQRKDISTPTMGWDSLHSELYTRSPKDQPRDRPISDLAIIPESRLRSHDFQSVDDHPADLEDAYLERISTENKSMRPYPLRRVASDGSLSYHRARSIASSLGDDTRFENVKEQINNRIKALKDSFQDTNFRLPSLPSIQMSNILGNMGKDVGKDDPSRGASEVGTGSASGNDAGEAKPLNESATKQPNGSYSPSPSYIARALSQLTGDVVVLGGYRGSVLRTAHEPHTKLWPVSLRAGFNLATVDLEVGFEDEDEDEMAKRVVADGMLTHVGPIDISRKLLKRLRTCENALSKKLRVHNYGYDWRLSPHRISRELISFLERLPCNSESTSIMKKGATVIAHSLGGLITRHAVNLRPDLFAGVIYAGVPDGCVNILGPFRKNDEVLFSPRVFSYKVTFSVRTSFALLPLNGRCFIDMDSREELPVDFFNVEDWIKYRLSPCLDPPLPASIPKTGLLNAISSSISISRSVGDMVNSLPFIKRKPSERTPPPSETSTGDDLPSEREPTVPHSDVPPDSASKAVPRPLPRPAALVYLARTLAATRRFKQELAHLPDLSARDAYPPLAVLYGKTEPTVRGARVRGGRAAIARADVYDSLVFGAGDGVVLARAAMPPEGYRAARGGVVGSDRGHIALLGDLEAVGRCLLALGRARRAGAGLGAYAEGGGSAGRSCE